MVILKTFERHILSVKRCAFSPLAVKPPLKMAVSGPHGPPIHGCLLQALKLLSSLVSGLTHGLILRRSKWSTSWDRPSKTRTKSWEKKKRFLLFYSNTDIFKICHIWKVYTYHIFSTLLSRAGYELNQFLLKENNANQSLHSAH